MEVDYLGRYLILLGIGQILRYCEYYLIKYVSDFQFFPAWRTLIGNTKNMVICLHFNELCLICCRNLQGTSMEGPIPSSISLLKNLEEL